MAMTLPLNQMAPLPAAQTPHSAPPPPPLAQHTSNPDWSSPGRMMSAPPGSGAHDLPPAMPQRMTAPIPWEPGQPEPAREPPQASTGQYAVAAIIGLVVAALIGTGAFFVWRSRTHAEPPTTETPRSAPPRSSIASAAPPPASAPPTTASPEIQFKVTPPDATLSVDGKELGTDVRKLPRPAAGTTVMLVAHSKDHEDVTILVDYFTTSPVDIVLKPAGAPVATPSAEADAGILSGTAAGGGGGTASTATADPEGTKEKPKPKPKPREKDPNGLPANPY